MFIRNLLSLMSLSLSSPDFNMQLVKSCVDSFSNEKNFQLRRYTGIGKSPVQTPLGAQQGLLSEKLDETPGKLQVESSPSFRQCSKVARKGTQIPATK